MVAKPVRQGPSGYRRCTTPSNATVLNVTLSLTLLITAAQLIAAWQSRSLALLADGGSMLVDVLTYAANRYAESVRLRDNNAERAQRVEFATSMFSVVALFGVVAFTVWQAVERLIMPDENGRSIDIGSSVSSISGISG